jgi:molybdopterin/thiamine biosynthesis adenylyltransferase
MLDEVGENGQEKLFNSKVLVIGAGGLGSPASLYLAAAGVGTIGIADSDVVELSNLQRQVLHSTDDLGKPKTESAKETLTRLNPDVTVLTYQMMVTEENIGELIADYDFIIEATDNLTGKFLVNDACVKAGKPFSHGGINRMKGQTMTYVPGKGACYRCVFREMPAPTAKNTAKVGVFPTVPGIIGTIQATEALKFLLGEGDLLTGYLLTYNAKTMEFRKIPVPRDADCSACKGR